MKDYIVCNFSGGKDSTAMVLRMIELGEHIDEVVCCDTYKEFPAMYRHIERVQKIIEEHGIKFTMLRSEKSFDYLMFEHDAKRKNPKFRGNGNKGYSWAYARNRWCTKALKISIMKKHMKQLKQIYNIVDCVGIAFDEAYRLKRKNNKQEGKRHPLVEWKWTEADCLEYCYQKGFDWEGLYDIFDRVSCWCCPLKSLKELRKLRKHFPDLWFELKDMDNRTWLNFKAGWSVADLEKRFALEDEFNARGESITSREFYRKLKVLLGRPLSIEEQDAEKQVSFF